MKIKQQQLVKLNDIIIRKKIHDFIYKLCIKNKTEDFEGKFNDALMCYKNATYYGILRSDLVFKFIEIGFAHPVLAQKTPYKNSLHKDLISYNSSEELQIDFLQTELNYHFDPA